ncbi:Enolase-phosphatase E1, partial [Halocaridina rubra]
MKREFENYTNAAEKATTILLDIEGTTTSISFVKDELFPYVRREVEKYLQETWEASQTKADVEALIEQ